MAVNKVWNPQYILWVFAAGALAAMPARFGVALGAPVRLRLVVSSSGSGDPISRAPSPASGIGATIARLAVLAWMASWTIGQLRGLGTVPGGSLLEGAPTPAAS